MGERDTETATLESTAGGGRSPAVPSKQAALGGAKTLCTGPACRAWELPAGRGRGAGGSTLPPAVARARRPDVLADPYGGSTGDKMPATALGGGAGAPAPRPDVAGRATKAGEGKMARPPAASRALRDGRRPLQGRGILRRRGEEQGKERGKIRKNKKGKEKKERGIKERVENKQG